MRPVSGFERPWMQWGFVMLGVVLIGVAAAEAVALRRLRGDIAQARASEMSAQAAREETQIKLTQERAARQALSFDVERLRGGDRAGRSTPTLTLAPVAKRGAAPPEPTVDVIPDGESIQLRLLLPAAAAAAAARYSVNVRSWSGGETVWSRNGLRASTVDAHRMVTAFVTGDVFAPGAYEVALTAPAADATRTEIASYEVAVRNRPDR
jgi:hypothetical protein